MQSKQTVGIADMIVSRTPDDVIVTYALGSCLGITVYDPVVRVGGMLHAMLPTCATDPEKAQKNPFMFVDTGVPKLFLESYKLGAKKERLIVKVAGGACVNKTEDEDHFQIGKRNFLMLRKLLWKNGVLIKAEDVGGQNARTMSLSLADGEIIIRSNGADTRL
jgi:chemotaxis protein CheD